MWGVTQSYARHDAFTSETWRIHMWGMAHWYARNCIFIGESWFIHTWCMTHSYVRHDALICTHSYVRHDTFISEAWRIWHGTHLYICASRDNVCACVCVYVCARTRVRVCAWAHVRHATLYPCRIVLICETWLMHVCNISVTRLGQVRAIFVSDEWLDSFICASWRIYMCVMTHSYVQHAEHAQTLRNKNSEIQFIHRFSV